MLNLSDFVQCCKSTHKTFFTYAQSTKTLICKMGGVPPWVKQVIKCYVWVNSYIRRLHTCKHINICMHDITVYHTVTTQQKHTLTLSLSFLSHPIFFLLPSPFLRKRPNMCANAHTTTPCTLTLWPDLHLQTLNTHHKCLWATHWGNSGNREAVRLYVAD